MTDTELATTDQGAAPAILQQARPMTRLPAAVHAATVSIEAERAIAEVKGKLFVAKQFPRDLDAAHAELMRACASSTLAEKAFYSYSRGGENVSGPSIRLAEEIARCFGNIEYGIRELAQHEGKSEMEAYCWDMEKNTISNQRFAVAHIRDTKKGGKALTEQRDIYENNANMAGRRMRARILAIMPKWLVADSVAMCRATLANDVGATIEESRRKVSTAFGKHGVTPKMIEAKMGVPVGSLTAEQIVDLRGIFQAISDGEASVADHFDPLADQREKAAEIDSIANQTASATTPPPKTRPPTTTPPTTQPAKEPSPTRSPTPDATPKPKATAATKPSAPPPKETDAPPPNDSDLF